MAEKPMPRMSREEQVGYHKGALESLIKERAELYRLIQIVDQLIKLHFASLQKLGVKLTREEEKLEKKL